MADCDDVLRDLFVYLDGELSIETRAQISAHLEGCPDCYEVLDFHAELRQVIAHRCREDLPPGLVARVRSCFGDGAVGGGGGAGSATSFGAPASFRLPEPPGGPLRL